MSDTLEFIKHSIPKDKECSFAWHRLDPKSQIGPYVHPDEDEYFICGPGNFISIFNGVEEEQHFEGQANFFYVPKGTEHTFISKSDRIEYYVIKVKK